MELIMLETKQYVLETKQNMESTPAQQKGESIFSNGNLWHLYGSEQKHKSVSQIKPKLNCSHEFLHRF